MQKDDLVEVLGPEAESSGVVRRFRVPQDSESKKKLAKRVHDLNGSLNTLRLAVDAIRNGYRFDDANAEKKLQYLDAAVAVVERESHLIKILLST